MRVSASTVFAGSLSHAHALVRGCARARARARTHANARTNARTNTLAGILVGSHGGFNDISIAVTYHRRPTYAAWLLCSSENRGA